jgi:hypothetical protein
MDYYILTKDAQQAGPYSLDQLKAFWASGQITLTTPYWTNGMTDWYPVRAIEKLLAAQTPGPTTPVAAQSPEKPKRKGIGCGQACLILIVLVGGFIGFVMVMSPDEEEPSKPKIETSWDATSLSAPKVDTIKPKVETPWNKGYTSAYELGYMCALSDYNEGKLKESPEELDANARQLSWLREPAQ